MNWFSEAKVFDDFLDVPDKNHLLKESIYRLPNIILFYWNLLRVLILEFCIFAERKFNSSQDRIPIL